MLEAQGLEYEAAGHGEVVLSSHGGNVADGFLPLTGEASLADRYFPSMIPRTEGVVLPGVNHLIQMRDPKPVTDFIANFLSRQPV